MVLFFTSTLVLSIVAMIALLAVKQYELRAGRLLFAGLRPRLNVFFGGIATLSGKVLPSLMRQHAERAGRAALARLQLMLARAIVWLERMLERVLSAVREKTEEYVDREPSAFLREVADHKKNLQRHDE